ncbi:hypothetical protein YA0001_13665 [Pseudomonas viridiflava]|uniref:hypothetical protein n=1 Tax=Pseudomonas viridiflava TaxID=33069 RepID=UPI0018E5E55B|nr:hypothetical protein [Pseudomonas viridiflava]MBI6578183.1 hypothetical protein [Pseudomonas viridiflava]MBI6610751.1 hypothetical protein [Pseudomonas viridiflava]MBI6637005.1 hypothetical protein [Pseudomonas viridiflava]MBI6868623.1 hypothetical protein [Pseudomonas viridiflava]
MKSRTLAPAIEVFFKRTEAKLEEVYKPEWLFSDFDDAVWLINCSANSRAVEGVIKGCIKLSWVKKLPNGKLPDPCYKLITDQAKKILLLAFGGGLIKFYDSLKTIYGFHSFLIRVIEYMDCLHGNEFRESGFEMLNAETVVDMLEITVEAGICGTGFFIERWENYLSKSVSSPADQNRIRAYLHQANAFDSKGDVSMVFIGNAIGADANRLTKSLYFKNYMLQYSSTERSSAAIIIKEKTVSQLASWFSSLGHVLSSSSIQSSSDFDDPHSFNERLKPFRGTSTERTKTLPFRIANTLMSGCCTWTCDIFPVLSKYLDEVLEVAKKLRISNHNLSDLTALKLGEKNVSRPPEFEFYQSYFFEGLTPRVNDHPLAPSLIMKLLQLQSATCFALIALLSCSRKSEVIELCTEDAFKISGRHYLNVRLRKTGIDASRRLFAKPIPNLVTDAIKQLELIKTKIAFYYASSDPLFHSRIFFKISQMGVGPMTSSDIYGPLRDLSGCLDLRDSSGHNWHINPHQLRRFFAISFYHDAGTENSLPALSWFMGHSDIEGTWRYIKESLTGKEISVSEAAMAASAVCSDDASKGADRLRTILRKHFGCYDLSLMEEEDVQDYLELLSERGVYTATPITIRTGRNKACSVLIVIQEENNG